MRDVEAGIPGGLIAGGLMSGAMTMGRRSGFLARTPGEHPENRLGGTFATRRVIGLSAVAIPVPITALGSLHGPAR